MSTISNVNIVLQQGDGAKDAHNTRHASQEHSQVTAAQQKEKDAEQQATIQQPNHSEDVKFENTSREGSNRRHRRKSKKKKGALRRKGHFKTAGTLVDTVA